MKQYLHGPMDYAKTLKLRFRVGDLGLPERRKRYTSGQEEEKDAQMCPCSKAIESRPYIVGEYCLTPGGTGCVREDEESRRM